MATNESLNDLILTFSVLGEKSAMPNAFNIRFSAWMQQHFELDYKNS